MGAPGNSSGAKSNAESAPAETLEAQAGAADAEAALPSAPLNAQAKPLDTPAETSTNKADAEAEAREAVARKAEARANKARKAEARTAEAGERKAGGAPRKAVAEGPVVGLSGPAEAGVEPAEGIAPGSPLGGIGRSSRPAWRPMEPRPVRGGVTVFGTRLTYRQAAIGAAIVLLVLALIVTLVAQAFGKDDDKSGAAPGVGGPTATTPGPQPTKAQASTAPSSAAPSSAAPTTTAPSKAASSAPPAGGDVAIPANWSYRTYPASGNVPAFKIALPAKLTGISGGDSEIRFKYNNRMLLLGRTTSPKPDALKDWQQQERDRNYLDYHLISLKPATYRNYESVADWEFTYTTDSGNPQHVIRRNIRVDSSAAFSLSWYVSTSDWAASQSDLKLIYQTFQPL
ncbi:hypothetical protein [Paractinoplanes ferrugineus]|uniref:hypothetical protein n=1 Tax=Paractinoplanes ferrugineus TaxID=113564 RepID=UPI00194349BE|nr:hypothetical protein [Actinoplanes ferrugineus]